MHARFQRCILQDRGSAPIDAGGAAADNIGIAYYRLAKHLDNSMVDAAMGAGGVDFEIGVVTPMACRGQFIVANTGPMLLEMFIAQLPVALAPEREPREEKIAR